MIMHGARISFVVALGLLVARSSPAQESALGPARALSRASLGDAKASLAYGRALLRAGHDSEAAEELRRGMPLARGGALAIEMRWELARVAIAKHDFPQAMAHCRAVGAMPNGATAGHACAAEAHLLWRRGS